MLGQGVPGEMNSSAGRQLIPVPHLVELHVLLDVLAKLRAVARGAADRHQEMRGELLHLVAVWRTEHCNWKIKLGKKLCYKKLQKIMLGSYLVKKKLYRHQQVRGQLLHLVAVWRTENYFV